MNNKKDSDLFVNLKEILKNRILVIDGAMGTMIQRYNLTEADYRGTRFANFHLDVKGNNDLLSITQPDIISAIHKEYLEAGADILETNTFSANRVSMADYDMQELIFELNFESAKIAKSAAMEYTLKNPEKPRFVAGSIGPTNQTTSLSPDVNNPGFRKISFDELAGAYFQQIEALVAGGADLLLIETSFDTLNCKAAIYAAADYFEKNDIQLPIMISGTITDMSGRTLSGQTPEAFYISIAHTPNLISVGLNCALGSKQMRPFIKEIADVAECNVSLYPNAGLPNEFGGYDESPEYFSEVMKSYAQDGLINIAGGCCGTTPDHIRMTAEAVANIKPRSIN